MANKLPEETARQTVAAAGLAAPGAAGAGLIATCAGVGALVSPAGVFFLGLAAAGAILGWCLSDD